MTPLLVLRGTPMATASACLICSLDVPEGLGPRHSANTQWQHENSALARMA